MFCVLCVSCDVCALCVRVRVVYFVLVVCMCFVLCVS